MKLSQLTTEKATDVLVELTPYIANITSDESLMEKLKSTLKLNEATTKAQIYVAGAEMIASIVPIVFKDHKSDVFGILSVLNEKDVEDIKNQPFLQTLKLIKECVKDRELIDFFKSFGQQEKTESSHV